MDMLRSAHTALMDFAGDGSYIRKVRWYRCAPGALPFPGAHAFGASSWLDPPRQSIGLGEQWNSDFKWSNGETPPGMTGTGPVCGDEEWFRQGVPPGTPPLDLAASGGAKCCLRGDGIAVGGRSVIAYYSRAALGAKIGASSLSSIYYRSQSGLRVGQPVPGTAYLHHSAAGFYLGAFGYARITPWGVKVGLRGVPLLRVAGQVGVKVGLRGQLVQPVAGQVGVKVGLVGVPKRPIAGQVGVKVAPAGVIKPTGPTKIAGALGIKIGPAGTVGKFFTSNCCPGTLLPYSITGHDTAGTLVALTGDPATGGWVYFDTLNNCECALKCNQVSPGVYQWHVGPVSTAHCAQSPFLYSYTCSPFSIKIENDVSGAACANPGYYLLNVP